MKDFFRITKSKLIIAIIFFLLFPIWFRVPIFGGPNECQGAMTCLIGTSTSWMPLGGGLILIISIFVGGNQPFETLSDYLWKAPYLLITSYLLAAIIVYIISRKKKNR